MGRSRVPRHLRGHAFQKGQSGNPAGRPKGARSRLAETFVEDLSADWAEHGIQVIATVRKDRPVDYLRLVGSMLRKQIELVVSRREESAEEVERYDFAALTKDEAVQLRELVAKAAVPQPPGTYRR